jgi:topoisomerase-4 subunit B
MPGAEVPVEICTQIYSGGKFRKNMYDFSTGLHGVGLTLVNALSTEMRISTKNGDDKYSVYHFVDAKYINKDVISRTEEDRWSTEIAFKPDPKYFDRPDCIASEVEDRLMTIKFGLRDAIKVVYNDKEVSCNLMDGFLGNIVDHVEETFINIYYFNSISQTKLNSHESIFYFRCNTIGSVKIFWIWFKSNFG